MKRHSARLLTAALLLIASQVAIGQGTRPSEVVDWCQLDYPRNRLLYLPWFDKGGWRSGTDREKSCDRLIKTHALCNHTAADIRQLLGEPDSISKGRVDPGNGLGHVFQERWHYPVSPVVRFEIYLFEGRVVGLRRYLHDARL